MKLTDADAFDGAATAEWGGAGGAAGTTGLDATDGAPVP
jgi:hypothetical protein